MYCHMHDELVKAGGHAKLKQTREGMFAPRRGATSLAQARLYPLVTAASGDAETAALRRISELHDQATIMNCCPTVDRALRMSNLIFKLLSRQGCRFTELYEMHTEKFPEALFGLLG